MNGAKLNKEEGDNDWKLKPEDSLVMEEEQVKRMQMKTSRKI